MFWYEDEVKRLEKERSQLNYTPATLFYGSSSIRLWTTLKTDFESLSPVNLGFGGSTLAACTWFFDRIIAPYDAKSIVFYAGDNDLGDGRHPEEIFIFFQQLACKIKERYGDIPCYFISIKPSIARWKLISNLKYTNTIIENEIIRMNSNWKFIDIFSSMLDKNGYPAKEYFENDGLHLNNNGYALWREIVSNKILENFHTELT
jgi:lysophospholipase L1-like esterase